MRQTALFVLPTGFAGNVAPRQPQVGSDSEVIQDLAFSKAICDPLWLAPPPGPGLAIVTRVLVTRLDLLSLAVLGLFSTCGKQFLYRYPCFLSNRQNLLAGLLQILVLAALDLSFNIMLQALQAQMQAVEMLQKQANVQLILTTHSPNIGSKVELKDLVICSEGKAFPMGPAHTELATDDYAFLQRFLDVTKANLFFSKGVILVEGWSEELLVPEFAKLLGYNLTQKGIAVINVNSLAFIRYANIFKRKAKPDFPKPVAVITDSDVSPDNEDGAIKGDKAMLAAAIAAKTVKYDGQCVKSFIAPQWTLEYCLSKSAAFGPKFQEIAKAVHSGTEWTDFDATLAKKLESQSLKKTEIASRLAQAIAKGEIDKSKVAGDKHVEYLVKAIEYACGV